MIKCEQMGGGIATHVHGDDGDRWQAQRRRLVVGLLQRGLTERLASGCGRLQKTSANLTSY